MKDIYIECNNGITEDGLLAALYDLYENKLKFIDDINGIMPEMTYIKIQKKICNGISGKIVLKKEDMDNSEEELFPADSLYAFEVGFDDYLRKKIETENNTCNCVGGICTCGNGKNYMGIKVNNEMKPDSSLDENNIEVNNSGLVKEEEIIEDSLYAFEIGYDDYLRKKMAPKEDKKNIITLDNIEQLIDSIECDESTKEDCKNIFKIIAKSKGYLESNAIGRIDISEYTEIDDIVKILAICYLVNNLNLDRIIVSPINVGNGNIYEENKYIPIPRPITANILKNVPIISTEKSGELTSTTAAAILTYYANDFSKTLNMIYTNISYGFLDDKEDNYVRVFMGEFK